MAKHARPTGKAMENAKTDHPLDLKAGSPSQQSRTHASTAIQSSVKPEDYPKADRDEQIAEATGGRKAARKRDQ
jgi:hypothetical protein